ncbi:MAG: diacylglycerol kinase [Magnetococcales bacterium]|nr:diacylglycerol kinase [Magnetococcales bacterium]
MKPGATGLIRVIHATRYSMLGMRAAWQHEAAFRQELSLCLLLVPVALWLGRGGVEQALMIGALLLVVMVELLNSAVEAVVDRIGPELHPLAGRAKDLGSAAVFVALVNVVVIWGLILWRHLE